MSIRILIGSALFILSMSVAQKVSGPVVKLGIFAWSSSSPISRTDCKEHKRSSSGWSGYSKVRSPLEVKHIHPLSLERTSLLHRLIGAVLHSKRECFSVEGP